MQMKPLLPFQQTLSCWVLLSMLPLGRAAYIQHKECTSDVGRQRGNAFLHIDSLGAYLNAAQLELQIDGYYPGNLTCDRVKSVQEIPMLEMSTLGGSNTYAGEVLNTSCLYQESRHWTGYRSIRHMQVRYDIRAPAPLSSYDIKFELLGIDNSSLGCVLAPLTAGIRPALYWVALVLPITSFLATLLSALGGKLYGANRMGEASTNESRKDPGYFASLVDCLSYIQFMFFSGALSLSYPGFFQPIVGMSSWSTLMLARGPYFLTSPYRGIQDGIYEINGTFGGTSGMELMTQVMGAPVSLENWINVLLISVLVIIFLAILTQLHDKVPWIQAQYEEPSTPNVRLRRHLSGLWMMLRAYLTLFLLPIVAWTTYQLRRAIYFPIYYTIAAVSVVCIMLAACGLAFTQFRPKQIGYLIVGDIDKRFGEGSQSLGLYTVVIFSLLFSRGAIIGGLQLFGSAQVTALVACEAIQFAFAYMTLPRSFLMSRHALLSYARCAILLLCIGMVFNSGSISAKSACGYAILAAHVLVLVVLFLIPPVYELFRAVLKPTAAVLPRRHVSPLPRLGFEN